ncbi:hypothetical protein RE428_16850 [Marinobacter nanhaiticus D15-8W]|nr:hypothetical protein RE428_16850 [Marinobacter nanhaiticus D15-8W]
MQTRITRSIMGLKRITLEFTWIGNSQTADLQGLPACRRGHQVSIAAIITGATQYQHGLGVRPVPHQLPEA